MIASDAARAMRGQALCIDAGIADLIGGSGKTVNGNRIARFKRF